MQKKSFLRVVESSESFHNGVWKMGKNLVVSKSAVFPDRCVVCNAPAEGKSFNKLFFWHSPLLLPLIIISFPIYLLLAFYNKKLLQVKLPLCPYHWSRMLSTTVLSLLLIPQLPILGSYGIINEEPIMILAGLFSTLGGLMLLIWSRNPVWAWFIRAEYGLVKGAHPDFVDGLPKWEGEVP